MLGLILALLVLPPICVARGLHAHHRDDRDHRLRCYRDRTRASAMKTGGLRMSHEAYAENQARVRGKRAAAAAQAAPSEPAPSKFGNQKTAGYDSKREARRAARGDRRFVGSLSISSSGDELWRGPDCTWLAWRVWWS